MQTIATGLDAWQEPAIAAATIGESQISAERLLDGDNTLYLIAPAHDQRRLRGLFTALRRRHHRRRVRALRQTGQPIDPALLLALDEAANIAPLPNLDEIASTGPGQGVQLLTILQNISQAADRWGRDRAETIIANHRARLFCSGIGDRATLDYLRHTLGEEEITRISTHRQSALTPGSRTSDATSARSPPPTACASRPQHRAAHLRPPPARLAAPAPVVPDATSPRSPPAGPHPRAPRRLTRPLRALPDPRAVGPTPAERSHTPREQRSASAPVVLA